MNRDLPTVEIIQNMDSESLCVFVIITSLSDDVVLDIYFRHSFLLGKQIPGRRALYDFRYGIYPRINYSKFTGIVSRDFFQKTVPGPHMNRQKRFR